jgi:hypothetical protein
MRKTLWVAALAVLVGTVTASAATLDLAIEADSNGNWVDTITVVPDATVDVQITGDLSTTANSGLALFGVNLVSGGAVPMDLSAQLALTTPTGDMASFNRNLGLTNPGVSPNYGYGGTASGNDLLQVGGGQNTINNTTAPYPVGTPLALYVGHTGNTQVLAEFTLTAPHDEGTYTITLDGAFANTLDTTNQPTSVTPIAGGDLTTGALTVVVTSGDTTPPYIVGDWQSFKPAVGAAPELYIPIAQVGSPTNVPFKGVETRRGLITDLRITFSEAIQLPALTDVTMTRWAGGSTNPTGVSLDVTGTILTTTWTAVGDAAMVGAADIYTVCLQNIVDLAGNPLTGDNDIEVWQQFGNVQLAPAGATRRSTGNADISLMNANFVDPTDLARARFDVWNAPVGATGGKVNNSDVSQLSARFSTLNAAAVPPTCP